MKTFMNWLESYYDDEYPDYDDGQEPAELQGEYWISEDGHVMGAGEADETNHEGHVIQHVQSAISDKVGANTEDWEEVKKHIASEAYQEMRDDILSQREEAEKNRDHEKLEVLNQQLEKVEFAWEDEDIYPFLYEGIKNHGINEEELRIADGNGDAREYAMKNWGWKRVDDNHIETWKLTPTDIEAILSGVYDIVGDEEGLGKTEMYIFVYSSNRSYDTTYDQLEESIRPKLKQQQQQPHATTPDHSMPTPPTSTSTSEPPVDPTLRVKQMARDRYNADIGVADKAMGIGGNTIQKDKDLALLHPYYQNKKFPFADWTLRTHGKVL